MLRLLHCSSGRPLRAAIFYRGDGGGLAVEMEFLNAGELRRVALDEFFGVEADHAERDEQTGGEAEKSVVQDGVIACDGLGEEERKEAEHGEDAERPDGVEVRFRRMVRADEHGHGGMLTKVRQNF